MGTHNINPSAVLAPLPRTLVGIWQEGVYSHTDTDWAHGRRCIEALRLRARRGNARAAAYLASLRQDRARARQLHLGGLPTTPR